MEEILETFNLLRADLSDYARLASKEDTEYMMYSPWMNETMGITKCIEFNIDQSVPEVAEVSYLSKIWQENKTKIVGVGVASKWALFDKKKLQRVVDKFQKRNRKLREVLQLIAASQMQQLMYQGNMGETMIKDEDAKRLGLVEHAQIRELVVKPESINTSFLLHNTVLDSSAENHILHLGILKTTHAKGNSMTDMGLIEFKYYPTTPEDCASEAASKESAINSRVNQLASLLSCSGSNSMGTLPFRGFLHEPIMNRHVFVFAFPTGAKRSDPTSLRSIIDDQSKTNRWSLSARFHISQKIARNIGAFHDDGWIHKDLSSDSIVFFRD